MCCLVRGALSGAVGWGAGGRVGRCGSGLGRVALALWYLGLGVVWADGQRVARGGGLLVWASVVDAGLLVTSGGACCWVLGTSRGACAWVGLALVARVCWLPVVVLAVGRPGAGGVGTGVR